MANGLVFKARIITAGLRVWDVSRATGIHPSRLSGVLNNRLDPTPTELAAIERVILDAERKRAERGDGE